MAPWIRIFNSARLPVLFGAVLSTAVGTLFYSTVANTIDQDARERFDSLVKSAQYTILGRVKSYTDVLRGANSLFHTIPDLSREQFRQYVEGLKLETEFPAIETINFARSITEAQRPQFESELREELAKLNPPIKFVQILPPGRRAEYQVLTYLEPTSAAHSRFGADLRSRPASIAVLDESRDTGNVSSSGLPIKLKDGYTGLGMRLPVYRPDMPLATVAQRRAAFMGSVGLGFSVERLLSGMMPQLAVKGLRLKLIGVAPGDEPGGKLHRILLYDSAVASPGIEAGVGDAADDLRTVVPIDYNKRNWEAHFSIKRDTLYDGLNGYLPQLAFLAGFIGTALLYALFHTLARSRRTAVGLAQEMTRELRASEASLKTMNAQLRRLAAHTENIKEGERKRIAREIHDDLGQNLLALRIEADLLASRTGERLPRLHERATRTLSQIDTIIKSVRQIINDLRPNVLDLGLNAAVDWQVTEFRRRTGIPCDVVEDESDREVDDAIAIALFRILQESLTNITRHANATQVRVELHSSRDGISMTVIDNGVGLPPDRRHKPGSFGLVGIEERVKIFNGKFSVVSGPTKGTTIKVIIPLVQPPTSNSRENASEVTSDAAVVV